MIATHNIQDFLRSAFCVGDVEISNRTLLAPLAGVTDMPFRFLCKQFGCGLTVSEMISAKGLLYNNARTFDLMEKHPLEIPYAIQLFGSDPDIIAEAAVLIAEKKHAIIDINMGCPVPKVTNAGEGSALMKDIKLAERIIRRVAHAVDIPVTVKFRTGWDSTNINCVEFAKMCEASGAKLVTVHGRTREQYYSGRADWQKIAQVVSAVSIPVVANGDIFSLADAMSVIKATNCTAIMIGRGAMGNPWIFRELLDSNNRNIDKPSVSERIEMILLQLTTLIEVKGEQRAVKEMRSHAAWYTKDLYNSAELRERFNRVEKANEFIELFEQYKLIHHKREVAC